MTTGIVTLIGPNGAGKTELTKSMLRRFPDRLGTVVSTTTRSPRAEDDGRFRYVTEEEFEALDAAGKFTHRMTYPGDNGSVCHYGTQRSDIDAVVRNGKLGIGEFLEKPIGKMRDAGYRIHTVRIVPLRHKGRGNPARDKADKERESTLKAEFEIVNDHGTPDGFAEAEERLAGLLNDLFRDYDLAPQTPRKREGRSDYLPALILAAICLVAVIAMEVCAR